MQSNEDIFIRQNIFFHLSYNALFISEIFFSSIAETRVVMTHKRREKVEN